MNKQEIKEWIKSAIAVDCINEEDDGCFATRIYKKGDKYYSIDFYNFVPRPIKLNEGKGICDVYDAKEVKRKTRMVEEVYYEEVKEE
jgi:hypothetical protein